MPLNPSVIWTRLNRIKSRVDVNPKSQTKLPACVTAQSLVPLPLIFLIRCSRTALPALHQTHACSNSDAATAQIHGFHFFSYFGPYIWNSLPPKTSLCYSLFLQKQTGGISLLWALPLSSAVLHHNSVWMCVCVCVCVCVCCVCVCGVCVYSHLCCTTLSSCVDMHFF